MGKLIYLKDVVTLKLNTSKCIGCGMCLEVCPRDVLVLKGKKAFIADRDACIECGACAMNCPTEAVSVRAGVGCAAAIINSALGRTAGDSCCCVVEPREIGSESCANASHPD